MYARMFQDSQHDLVLSVHWTVQFHRLTMHADVIKACLNGPKKESTPQQHAFCVYADGGPYICFLENCLLRKRNTRELSDQVNWIAESSP